MLSIPLMTALLLTAGIPETQLAETGRQTSVRAGTGEFRKADGVLHVEGGAVVNSGGVWLKADSIDYGVADRSVSAKGNLVVVDGNMVVTGESGSLVIGQPESLKVQGATLYQKEQPVTLKQLDAMAAQANGPGVGVQGGEGSAATDGDSIGVEACPSCGTATSPSSSGGLDGADVKESGSSPETAGEETASSDSSDGFGESHRGDGSLSDSSGPESRDAVESPAAISAEERASAGASETSAVEGAASGGGDDGREKASAESSESADEGDDGREAPPPPPVESPEQREVWDRSEALATCGAGRFNQLGRNALVIKAGSIHKTADGYEAEDLRLTSCDCPGEDCPAWSLGASSASVTPGDGAWLRWPTFRIHDVPVLGFPIFYVPLSPRRTGFLFPKIEFSSSGGFGIDLPFFLTLGRSYDLTFTAGFLTSPFLALSSQDTQRESAWGPRGAVEFRYAPHRSTRGGIKFAGIFDRGFETIGGVRERRGFRGQLTMKHRTQLDNGFGLYADVAALGDARYLSDISDNLLASATTYLPSSARAFLRRDDFELTLASQWFQDLATARSGFFPEDSPMVGRDSPATYQRPALFMAQMPLKRIAGPLRLGGEFLASHTRPIGIGGPLSMGRLQASMRRTDVTDFYAVTRLDLAPRLWMPLIPKGPVRGDLTVGARGDFTAYSPVLDDAGSSDTKAWGRAYGDVKLWTELSRVYGQGKGALRHAIVPSFQLRGSTREFGDREDFDLDEALAMVDGTVIPLDELDSTNRAANPRLLQGVAAIRTRLSRPGGDGALTLTLGQGYDFTSMAWGETFGQVDTGFKWVSASVGARFDPELKELSLLQGRFRVTDPRGDFFSATYDLLRGSGTSLMRQGLDDLIGEQANPALDSMFQQVNLGVGVSIVRQVAVTYGIRIDPGADKGDQILLHSAGLKLRGKCDCWALDLGANWAPVTERWSAKFLVTLKNLGSFGN